MDPYLRLRKPTPEIGAICKLRRPFINTAKLCGKTHSICVEQNSLFTGVSFFSGMSFHEPNGENVPKNYVHATQSGSKDQNQGAIEALHRGQF
jgi:hypothetical protein